MCQADDLPACRLYPILGPDGRVEGPGVSHQCAVEDHVGLTSYVRGQGIIRLQLSFNLSVQLNKS